LSGTCNGSLLDTYCRQVQICTEIALQCMEFKRRRRPNIVEIIDKLNAMEHEMGMFEKNQGRHIERVCIRIKLMVCTLLFICVEIFY
jgi:hypothetical protein